jgi:hypothetical protein
MTQASIPFALARHAVCLAIASSPMSVPAALAADKAFQLPEGCTAFATAQLRSCQVAHYYTCSDDEQGEQWGAYLDGQGAYYLSKIDYETRWTVSQDLITGEVEVLGEEAADPASFTTLLQTGYDDFDFTTLTNGSELRRFVGWDELTGETVTIDGVTLERTRFDLSAYAADGSFLWRRTGAQFIHRDWRRFLSDVEDFENFAGDRVSSVSTPVDFAFPGDKDFLTVEPRYDCDVLSAEAQSSPALPGFLQ